MQDTKHYGRVLVAKKFFKMGEVVLLEKPTLTSEVKLTEQEEALLVYNDPWDKTRLRYVKAFCMANQKVKDEVREGGTETAISCVLFLLTCTNRR